MFFISQHISNIDNLKDLSLLAFPKEFPKIFSRASVPPIGKPKKESTSDLIAKIQNNELREIGKIWAGLDIKSDLFDKSGPSLRESFKLEIAPEEGPLYVYTIADKESNDWQYLFFNIKNRGWNFFGHIDLPKQASSEPIYRTVTIADRAWLVITSRSDLPNQSGIYQDHWYDLTGSQLREVLRYHVYHDQLELNFIKRYSATVLETGMVAGSYFIDLDTKITYLNSRTSEMELAAALSISNKVRYLWDNAGQKFKNHSHRSQNELSSYGADEILVHNYFQIGNLAVNGSPAQRGQIRQFIELCGNIPEKREILKRLNTRH
jgi:hypothetical protein